RVPRRAGYIGLSHGAVATLSSLKRVFPIVKGWVSGTLALEISGLDIEDLRLVPDDDAEDLSYDLAQSVLLLDNEGTLSDHLLIRAGLFGVPCIGPRTRSTQRLLWP